MSTQQHASDDKRITCAILAYNVSNHIVQCVESCLPVGKVVVFDSQSADDTVSLARRAGAWVIDIPFVNFSQARNEALNALNSEWVFFVDADERVTPELAEEVRQVARREDVDGWWVPRYNFIVGHRMKGGGWYPDYQLRLLRRVKAHYDPDRSVHEFAIVDGPEGRLKEHLIHYNYDSWEQFHAKQQRYTRLEVETLRNEGVRGRPRHLITRPLQAFWRRFVTWKGYRDGLMGLRLSLYMARYEQLKYWWLLREG